jgi:uncharacterized membrane protein
MIYASILTIHSWLRWVVILTGLVAFARAASGASGRKPWTPSDDRAGFWFVMTLDAQVLLGLIMYIFLSPITHEAFTNFAAAMKDSARRFWAVEHILGMIVALALAHIGRVRSRRTDSLRRHRVVAIFFGLALVVMLASSPWPGMPAGRPLLRW